MGKRHQHVGQTGGNADVPEDGAGAFGQSVGGCFTEREVNDAMAVGMESLKDTVTDVARDHVHDQIGGAVVGGGCVKEVEGGWCLPGRNVKEMHIKARLTQFTGHEGTNQTATEAVNPHAFSL